MNDPSDPFTALAAIQSSAGTAAMFDTLVASLAARGRWHAVFDARVMQARLALGLAPVGDLGGVSEATRERLDQASLVACREAGWPLLEAGQVAAAWMYLRAAVDPGEVAPRLAALADSLQLPPDADDEEASRRYQELVGVALWEGADPALGITLVLRTQGTCNAITAYEQAVSRLPAARQQTAAGVLVAHLHREVAAAVAGDLERRGIPLPADRERIPDLLAAAGGLRDDPAVHVDVSHLQSVLRTARVSTDPATIRLAYELAAYGLRLPPEVTYPGEPPFENVSQGSFHFFGAQCGSGVPDAIGFFRRAAAAAGPEAGTLPCDTLVLLLWRLGRAGEALVAALDRPTADGYAAPQVPGLLPSLVDLAAASGEWQRLRDACQARGDEITFAAALAAETQNGQNQQPGRQVVHGPGAR